MSSSEKFLSFDLLVTLNKVIIENSLIFSTIFAVIYTMPEGPETKRMVDTINRDLVNKKIISTKFYHQSLDSIRTSTIFGGLFSTAAVYLINK